MVTLRRPCPNCAEKAVPVSALLFSPTRCPHCSKFVRVARLPAAVVNLLILLVTVVTTGMIFLQAGLYGAIVWLPFPIGALSYVKARFCKLEAMPTRRDEP